jgi:hypothetical protein
MADQLVRGLRFRPASRATWLRCGRWKPGAPCCIRPRPTRWCTRQGGSVQSLSHMWNGPRGKDVFQTHHHAGTVQSYVRPLSAAWTAGLDEVRDARDLSHLRAVSAVRKTACLASGFRPHGIIVCSCTSPLTAILRRSASLDQLRVHALATPVAASIFRYVPPFVRSAQMIRAILLASATATTL